MTRRLIRLMALAASCGTTMMMVVACNSIVGLDHDYELMNSGVTTEAGPSTTTTTPPSSGDDAGADTQTAADTGAPNADTGALPDTSVTPDTSTPPGDTGAPDTFQPPVGVIHCGSLANTCSVPTQVCCSKIAGGYSCPTTNDCDCKNAGACTQLHLDCDDKTDCAGAQVCCGSLTGDRYALQGAICTNAASCTSASKTPLCDMAAAVEQCPDGGVCHPFQDNTFPGVGRCF